MRRRDFVTLVGGSAVTGAFARLALAQRPKVPFIAYLSIPELPERPEAFRQGLVDHGYLDGKNIRIQRFVAPPLTDLPAYAAMAVASRPDIIATSGTPASLAR